MPDSNPEIDALVARYGEDTVRAAFAIAQSIGDSGFDGFISNAQQKAECDKQRV